jgi:DNA-binding beta-propeller fold protein YncE
MQMKMPTSAHRRVVGFLWLVAACGAPADRGTVLTTVTLNDRVVVLDAATGSVRDSISLDPRPMEIDEPHGLAAAPDGRHWYATVSHGESTLWKFERPDNRLVGRVRLGTSGAARIGITPDSRVALVPDYYRDGVDPAAPSQVAVVELGNLRVTARLELCPAPHDAQVSPDGSLAAVACSLSDEVVLVDLGTLEPVARVPLDRYREESERGGGLRVKPLNLVWGPEGENVYVTLHLVGKVVAIDRSGSGETDRSVAVGSGPAQLALTPDGATLVVANRGDGTVSLVDRRELVERRRIDLGVAHPHGVAISADGRTAFVSYEGDTTSDGGVVAVDLISGDVVWHQAVGQYHLGVMYLTARH